MAGAAGRAEAAVLTESGIVTFRFGIETNSGGRTVIDQQHTDIGIPYVGGAWDVHVHGDEVGEFQANEALLYANPGARVEMPDMPFYNSFIGATAGSTVWIMPQTQSTDLIFLGFGAEEMTQADIDSLVAWNPGDSRGSANTLGKWLRVELVSVSGPGEFSMWANSGFGNPDVFFSTAEGGITSDDVVHVVAGGHSHYNWGFTEAGEYEISLRVSTFAIPEPSTNLLIAAAGVTLFLVVRRRSPKRA
jgi:hypothetical protein